MLITFKAILVIFLIMSYLENRKQRVRIDKSYSNYNCLSNGLSQGTALGPLLFLIYLNDIFLSISNDKTTCFADDTSITIHCKTWYKTLIKTENSLSYYLTRWLDTKGLVYFKTKCTCFNLSESHLPVLDSILIHDFECTNQTKYLGIICEQNLKWKK